MNLSFDVWFDTFGVLECERIFVTPEQIRGRVRKRLGKRHAHLHLIIMRCDG